MQMVHDEENWEYYSAAIVKLQVEFVKKLPANVKDLIRLVKYWRKTYIPQSGSKHLPPFYLLELLTIHAWENANRPERFDVKIGFKAVMEALKNPHNLRVIWEHYYRRELIPSRYIRKVFKNTFPQRLKELLFTFSRSQAVSVVNKTVEIWDTSVTNTPSHDALGAFCMLVLLYFNQM